MHIMNLTKDFDLEAFSANQISSKLWAAEELELCIEEHNIGPLNMYMLGGWYATLFFILKIRNKVQISECRSFDLDPETCMIANSVNALWEKDGWQFKSYPKDVNELTYPPEVNCVINTSSEHMDVHTWYEEIPKGTLCLIQSNDLEIDEHVNTVNSIRELKSKYPLETYYFAGSKNFETYSRFMIIGVK